MTSSLWTIMVLFNRLVMMFVNGKIDTEMMIPSELPIPPNNHGIQPLVIVDKEIKLSNNNLLATIPILSTEWSLTVDVRVAEFTGQWGSVFTFTNGNIGAQGIYGNRTPFLNVMPDTKNFFISSSINGNWNKHFYNLPYKVNQTHHVEIHQRYISNGEYRYYIVLDGVEAFSMINTDARQFYNVRCYLKINDGVEANTYIKNLKLANFM